MGRLGDVGAAVIGTGFIGTVHVEALRRIGIHVAGVLGSSAERAAAQAAKLGVARAYGSLDELLADEAVRVVHVTSPNRLHHAQARAILAAGRHVVCEKPLALTSAESAELVGLAAATGSSTRSTSTSASTPSTSTSPSSFVRAASGTSGW